MSHGHDHGHDHSHGHGHAPADYGRAFAIGIALNLIYVAAQAAFGLAAGSLALLADAGHNLGDVLGLGLSWGAVLLGRRGPSGRYTYGLRSSSILAALANALVLLMVTGGIAWEALRRLGHPVPTEGGIVAVVAAIGIVVNGVTALLFASGRGKDLNLRSAFMHMAADAVVTAGVVVAGIAIALTGLLWLDPVVSLVVSAVIVYGTWDLVWQSLNLALAAVPQGVDAAAVRAHLLAVPGVTALHDLHIWGMSTTETALTCHLVMPQGHPGDDALSLIAHELEERFHIHHTTLQIELGDSAECALTPEHVV
ncbi:MAG TPA: cation diffusion facilitator family transporter [Stellaceae bacterium]|jgi:cobalt-zinc-cadmium efflux system protein|nr:cation diffusion facilitator family transporter [Stellaceae bacterium]